MFQSQDFTQVMEGLSQYPEIVNTTWSCLMQSDDPPKSLDELVSRSSDILCPTLVQSPDVLRSMLLHEKDEERNFVICSSTKKIGPLDIYEILKSLLKFDCCGRAWY